MKKFIDEKSGMEQWSPQQISGYGKTHGIAMVSHERIYQYVYQEINMRPGKSLNYKMPL